ADLLIGQADRDQSHAGLVERFRRLAGSAGPTHPGTAGLAHHRFQRGDQAAGAAPPGGTAVRLGDPVHRQPIGHDDEVVIAGYRIPIAGGLAGHVLAFRTGWPVRSALYLQRGCAGCPAPNRRAVAVANPSRVCPARIGRVLTRAGSAVIVVSNSPTQLVNPTNET